MAKLAIVSRESSRRYRWHAHSTRLRRPVREFHGKTIYAPLVAHAGLHEKNGSNGSRGLESRRRSSSETARRARLMCPRWVQSRKCMSRNSRKDVGVACSIA